MIRRELQFVVALAVVAGLSCAHGGKTPPTASPAPAAGTGAAAKPAPPPPPPPPVAVASGSPAGPPPGGPPGGMPPGGGRGPGGRGPQLTPEQRAARRDSLATMRGQAVQQLMAQLAGSENKRAGDVFKNLQLLQDSSVATVLKMMDQNFGRALSVSCSQCHVVGQWADDSRGAKKTARVMIEMVNMINSTQLSKLANGGRSPTINCVTCHRGNTGPGSALLP